MHSLRGLERWLLVALCAIVLFGRLQSSSCDTVTVPDETGLVGDLAYAFAGTVTWVVETETQMKARPASPGQSPTLPPAMHSSQRLLLQEKAEPLPDGSWQVSIQVLDMDSSMESEDYSSRLTYQDGRAARTIGDRQSRALDGAWDKILGDIPQRAIFAEPVRLAVLPSGKMPGLAELPSETLYSIPGQHLSTVLSYVHPLLPGGPAAPGTTWEAPAPQDGLSASEGPPIQWAVERIDTRKASPLAVLRGRGLLRAGLDLVDVTDTPASVTVEGEFSGRVRFDLSRHRVSDARYTKTSDIRTSNASQIVMTLIERAHVRVLPEGSTPSVSR